MKVSTDFVVVLHNIRSLYNVGSMFRTADGAGVKKIYLCGITPSPVDDFGKLRREFAKVALGAEKFVEWDTSGRSTRATVRLVGKLKKQGYTVFAIEQAKNSIPYYRVQRQVSGMKKIVLIAGSEVRGLPPSILKQSDKILEIPMRGAMVRQDHHPRHAGPGKESLNVAVAFGIVAYHLSGANASSRRG